MPHLLSLLPLLLLSSPLQDPVTTVEGRLASWAEHERLGRESGFADLHWRAAGPRFAGGRIEAVTVPADDPFTIYLCVQRARACRRSRRPGSRARCTTQTPCT